MGLTCILYTNTFLVGRYWDFNIMIVYLPLSGPEIHVGTQVVRGPDWQDGDQVSPILSLGRINPLPDDKILD